MGIFDKIRVPGSKQPVPEGIPGIRMPTGDTAEQEIEDKLAYDRAHREGFGKFIRHPLQVLTEKPINILIVCVPVALIFFFIGFVTVVRQYGMTVIFTTTIIDDITVITILIALGPLAILDVRESKRIKNLEEALP